jgi:hypothetical protein
MCRPIRRVFILLALPLGAAVGVEVSAAFPPGELTLQKATELHAKDLGDQKEAIATGLAKLDDLAKQKGPQDEVLKAGLALEGLFEKQHQSELDHLRLLDLPQRKSNPAKTAIKTLDKWLTAARLPAHLPFKSDSPILDDYDYSGVEEYVRAVPKDAEKSIAALAAYLAKGTKNDREKAWAISTWITENLAYDYDELKKDKRDQRPETALASKAAVCEGISKLYVALAQALKLEVAYVIGRDRQPDQPNADLLKFSILSADKIVKGGHAWNVIKIKGKWYMVDLTRANGRAKNNGAITVKRMTQSVYYLIPPHWMIYTHVPEDTSFQCMNNPVAKADADRLPLLDPAYFILKLKMETSAVPALIVKDESRVIVEVPPDVTLIARLIQNGDMVPGDHHFIQRTGKSVLVRTLYPQSGVYVLSLFARKTAAKDNVFQRVTTYRVEATVSGKEAPVLPQLPPNYHAKGACLYLPQTGILKAAQVQQFAVRLPGAMKAGIFLGKSTVPLPLQRYGELFVGKAKVEAGPVKLGAEYPDKANLYWHMVHFEAK